MTPLDTAATDPERPAILMAGSGESLTYGALADGARRAVSLFRSLGLERGDHIAILMENHPRFLELCWGAQLAGLYYTPISVHLRAAEVAYILRDCGAALLVASVAVGDLAAAAAAETTIAARYAVGGPIPGFTSWEAAAAAADPSFAPDGPEGSDMLYSSGTTGHPKGVKRPLSDPASKTGAVRSVRDNMFRLSAATRLLTPAPLYHAAPLRMSLSVLRLGGLVVVLDRFEPEACLAAIAAHRVTHAQFVPTMFTRFLKMPPERRMSYDGSSLEIVIHAAAPCPVPVKAEIIAWWGPIVFEYYGGTEGNGLCAIDSREWLTHQGSVGRAKLGTLHIVGEDQQELPVGRTGDVYFEGGPSFEYHNDPEKTRAARHPKGWTTLGDVGHLDAEGYLYLTDRRAFTIVSGGVNIYPQEIENLLVTHPAVADVAVFGVPNEDFGEEVKAVVEPRPGVAPSPVLADELIAFCRGHLGRLKVPRSIDFQDRLPRSPTGKLHKTALRDAYWPDRSSRIL